MLPPATFMCGALPKSLQPMSTSILEVLCGSTRSRAAIPNTQTRADAHLLPCRPSQACMPPYLLPCRHSKRTNNSKCPVKRANQMIPSACPENARWHLHLTQVSVTQWQRQQAFMSVSRQRRDCNGPSIHMGGARSSGAGIKQASARRLGTRLRNKGGGRSLEASAPPFIRGGK